MQRQICLKESGCSITRSMQFSHKNACIFFFKKIISLRTTFPSDLKQNMWLLHKSKNVLSEQKQLIRAVKHDIKLLQDASVPAIQPWRMVLDTSCASIRPIIVQYLKSAMKNCWWKYLISKNGNSKYECEWLFVLKLPCNKLATHPGVTLPSPNECWDRLRLSKHSGTGGYKK